MTCLHEDGAKHSCAYVEARSALIPAAEHYALRRVGPCPPSGPEVIDWMAGFNAAFHGEMTRLWARSSRETATERPVQTEAE